MLKNTRSGIGLFHAILVLLLLLIVVLLGVLIYQALHSKPTIHPAAQSFEPEFNQFFNILNTKNVAKQQAHTQLYAYLHSLQSSPKPKAKDVRKYVASVNIPGDYTYFFETCLPGYMESQKTVQQKQLSDEHLIFAIPPQSEYKAKIAFNTENVPVEAIHTLFEQKGWWPRLKQAFHSLAGSSEHTERVVVSGTYTSPFNMPVGLAIDQGNVVNPALQKWDGLLIINGSGQVFIVHVDDVQYDFRNFHLRTSYSDYIAFIELAKRNRFSVIQSHLLINHGEILIKDDPKQQRFRRRVIFQTADQGVYIYDSFDQQPLTLFETATLLKDRYKAVKALNVDIGVYNYCVIYSGKTMLKNYSHLQKGVVLSNLLVIEKLP